MGRTVGKRGPSLCCLLAVFPFSNLLLSTISHMWAIHTVRWHLERGDQAIHRKRGFEFVTEVSKEITVWYRWEALQPQEYFRGNLWVVCAAEVLHACQVKSQRICKLDSLPASLRDFFEKGCLLRISGQRFRPPSVF
ncbi:hypothetical protein AAFF_G00002190 [Aldrovandia affinis]|uniref:Uncharacterized protein n=1 Tax=Aldrovandia affinis TaxID=143900 RepID=A0AAD7TDA4_9TELE|nr:hypothetical protein AAFF_G00002190 [Aldrovandia affinis]